MESVKQTRFVFVEEEFPPLAQKALKAQGRTDSPKVGNGLVLKSDNLLGGIPSVPSGENQIELSKSRGVSLMNDGNLCFVNATTNMLLDNETVQRYMSMYDEKIEREGAMVPFLSELRDLMVLRKMSSSDEQVVLSAKGLRDIVADYSTQ